MLECKDCKLPYRDFGLDTVLPRNQWKKIAPEDPGIVLCANCMVKRASKYESVINAHMIFEIFLED